MTVSDHQFALKNTSMKHIHQILLSDDIELSGKLSRILTENISSLQKVYPHAKYTLWTKFTLRAFIKDNFPNRVISAYDSLAAYTAKADLGRYCLLFIYGGIYSDLSNYFFASLPISEQNQIACFRDVEPYAGASWAVTPTILYAAAGQDELRLAINLLVANVEARHYGTNALCPTGPILFGRALALLNRPERYWIGQMSAKSGTYPNRNHVFVGVDDQVIAVRMQREGGKVSLIGLRGGNDYNLLWRKRRYFGESGPLFINFIERYKKNNFVTFSNDISKYLSPEITRESHKRVFGMRRKKRKFVYRFLMKETESEQDFDRNWEEVCALYPRFQNKIMDEHDLHRFMSENFNSEIMNIYDRIACLQIKADLARWGLLLINGGIYIDVRNRLLNPFHLPRKSTLGFFRSATARNGMPWSINSTLIYSRPHQAEIRLAFDLTVAICRRTLAAYPVRYDGASSILGRAVAISYRQKRYWCGETLVFSHNPSHTGPRFGLMAPDGTLIAVVKEKRLGTVSS